MDQKEEIISFINSLPSSEEDKQKLLGKLEQEGITQGLIDELFVALDSNDAKIRTDYADQIEELTNDESAFEEEISKASEEFAAEMEAIEIEAAELDKSSNQELDAIELDSTRETLS